MTSRSERSYHGRSRTNTHYAVVGRRRGNASATSSPSTRGLNGYDSEGADTYEPRGPASRESSSDSLRSSSDMGESAEREGEREEREERERERRISRGSSLDSFEIVEKTTGMVAKDIEGEEGEGWEKSSHLSSSYDSAMVGSEKGEERSKDGEGGRATKEEEIETSEHEPLLPPPPPPPLEFDATLPPPPPPLEPPDATLLPPPPLNDSSLPPPLAPPADH